MEVRQQYWQVAVARRRATEQRCFLQGRIGLEKKLHGYHLAKCAKSRGKDKATYLILGLARAQHEARTQRRHPERDVAQRETRCWAVFEKLSRKKSHRKLGEK